MPISDPNDVIGINLVDNLEMEHSTLKTTSTDTTSQVVMDYVLQGWPSDKDHVDECAREYWNYKEELSVEDRLLFKSDRLVVPKTMRPDVLNDLHGAHLGENKSLSLARDYVFWPSMTAHIKQWRTVRVCKVFSEYPGISEKNIFLKKLIPSKPKFNTAIHYCMKFPR